MKIAIISDRVFPFFKGGAEKRYWEIAKRLAGNGHEIHFFTGQWPEMKKNMTIDGIYLHGVYKVNKFYKNGKKSISESIKYAFTLLPYLLKEDYDLIDCEQFPILSIFPSKIASVIRRKPLILTWHEVWSLPYWMKYIGLKGIIGYLFDRSALLMGNAIISVSKRTTDNLKISPFVRTKVHTIELGVDSDRIHKIKPSSVKSDIIFAGRLLSHKNIDVLIESIVIIKESNPNIKCFIIGEGPEKKRLEKMATSLDLAKNILFMDFLENHDELYSLMKSSKVFVLPSTREGFGLVVPEANACGLPVITINHKDNVATDLIIDGKNGFLCDLNSEQIAKKTIYILNNNIKVNMHVYSINYAQEYNWNTIAEKVENYYLKELK